MYRPATIGVSRLPDTDSLSFSVSETSAPIHHIRHFNQMRLERAASFSRSSLAFGSPFAVFFVTLAATLYALVTQGVIPVRIVWVVMMFLPLVSAFCAAPVAKYLERQFDVRHRRELAEHKRRQQETNLRLLLLQAQIEPHFLFNTLASLRALIREDVAQAEGLVDALVAHLRAVLPRIRDDIGSSTLSDQIAICASYLELMSIRLDGRLAYHIDVPPLLQNSVVPPLMLLTLVENAVKHGIEPKSDAGTICIEARSSLDSAQVIVAVTDDGIGIADTARDGLGLQNLREQLTLRYGGRASLSLASHAAGGTVASLLIPRELVSEI